MSKWRHERSSRLIRNLSNCEREAWKKFRLQRDSNPWPLRYRCSALPTELWSHNCWEQVNFSGSIMPLRVIQHYSDWVCTAVMSKWRHERSSRLIRNLSNACEREAWKKFRLQRDIVFLSSNGPIFRFQSRGRVQICRDCKIRIFIWSFEVWNYCLNATWSHSWGLIISKSTSFATTPRAVGIYPYLTRWRSLKKQLGKQVGRETERRTGRQTDSQIGRQIGRQTDTYICLRSQTNERLRSAISWFRVWFRFQCCLPMHSPFVIRLGSVSNLTPTVALASRSNLQSLTSGL